MAKISEAKNCQSSSLTLMVTLTKESKKTDSITKCMCRVSHR